MKNLGKKAVHGAPGKAASMKKAGHGALGKAAVPVMFLKDNFDSSHFIVRNGTSVLG